MDYIHHHPTLGSSFILFQERGPAGGRWRMMIWRNQAYIDYLQWLLLLGHPITHHVKNNFPKPPGPLFEEVFWKKGWITKRLSTLSFGEIFPCTSFNLFLILHLQLRPRWHDRRGTSQHGFYTSPGSHGSKDVSTSPMRRPKSYCFKMCQDDFVSFIRIIGWSFARNETASKNWRDVYYSIPKHMYIIFTYTHSVSFLKYSLPIKRPTVHLQLIGRHRIDAFGRPQLDGIQWGPKVPLFPNNDHQPNSRGVYIPIIRISY